MVRELDGSRMLVGRLGVARLARRAVIDPSPRTVTLTSARRPLLLLEGDNRTMVSFDDLNAVLEIHHHDEGEARAFLLRSAATSSDCGPLSWLLSLFELKGGSLSGAWSGGWVEQDVHSLVCTSSVNAAVRDRLLMKLMPAHCSMGPCAQLDLMPDATADVLYVVKQIETS